MSSVCETTIPVSPKPAVSVSSKKTIKHKQKELASIDRDGMMIEACGGFRSISPEQAAALAWGILEWLDPLLSGTQLDDEAQILVSQRLLQLANNIDGELPF